MKEVVNPFLPLNVYIPDGEPHVFGSRVYLFGSHDAENADTFCSLGYEIYSAPIDDLTNWTSKGINYEASLDPLSKSTNRSYMYAPDCVQGTDGRFYLYYSLSGYRGHGGYFGPISVAVADTPDGKYEFYGHVKNKDGSLFRKYVLFDPAVINDDGVIRLYYGTYYPFSSTPRIFRSYFRKKEAAMFGYTIPEILEQNDDVMGPITVTLDSDMLTVISNPIRILPVHERNTEFKTDYYFIKRNNRKWSGHGFFEGSSIRKINGLYYFIYSTMNNCELAYATSKYPDRDFKYGGIIVSTGDVGINNRSDKDRLNFTATTHGSIECINGKWYVFYHRQTHGSDYSRQACAEEIEILPDGSIKQVSVTSCGLNGKPLQAAGEYSAAICCNLSNGKMPHGSNSKVINIPMIYSENGYLYVKDLTKNSFCSYKYFNLSKTNRLTISARGEGVLALYINDTLVDKVEINSKDFNEYKLSTINVDKSTVTFKTLSGRLDLLKLIFG